MTRSDHQVFKRPTRQQLITRRRSVGLQALIFATPVEPLRCRRCARAFNATWKAFLCHVCGLWACYSCSSVIERERDLHIVRSVRACAACLNLVNKWPDPALLADYVATLWVAASSKYQLPLNLADALRTNVQYRGAVLVLLRHLGRPIAGAQHALLDNISESDWISTTIHAQDDQNDGDSNRDVDVAISSDSLGNSKVTPASLPRAAPRMPSCKSGRQTRAAAHMLVQQCFDVSITELPIGECVFAENDGVRTYPTLYEEHTEYPVHAPTIATEAERIQHIIKFGLTRAEANTLELQLLCDLAAKELEAASAFISIVHGDVCQVTACRLDSLAGAYTKRAHGMCAYALATPDRPFLVRDTALDYRFRNLEVVVGGAGVRFFLGFPIVASSGVPVASLSVMDAKPRRLVTTMQYSILKTLAAIVARIWEEKHRDSVDEIGAPPSSL
ncbi:hypothetical protein PybrP1_009577 [[Pythium] brassicae (nom. inval.)]|nr:hypothetical protein PybrP1_009577 [[Pythium] brassicae (nom. inval.)]